MTWDGGGASTSFGGTDITYDLPSLTITGGTVNGMVETRDGAVTYAVHGVAMSAQALFEAAQTSSTADDAALIRAALSGPTPLCCRRRTIGRAATMATTS